MYPSSTNSKLYIHVNFSVTSTFCLPLRVYLPILQVRALKGGVDVVVATPGRLEDLVSEGSCRLQGVTYMVLDEADRMLDLGFEPHIR